MPPKKAAGAPSKKTEQKKKDKIVEVSDAALCDALQLNTAGQNVRSEKQE